MTTLSELYYSKPRPLTDKGECHDYINSYYTKEFANNRESDLVILEIGLFKGGSCELWSEWFTNAKLYGIEITPFAPLGRTVVYIGDAYSEPMLNNFENIEFDYIIDDGPHTLESQIAAIRMWGPKLKKTGKLIVEDVRPEFLPHLVFTAELCGFTHQTFDLRSIKDRFDDIIFEVTRND